MNKDYYKDYFYLERHHWWFKARRTILETHIAQLLKGKKVRILNVGAATGSSSDMLSAFGEVVSLEYDQDCCTFVKEMTGQDFICASVTELPFDDASFDLVCAFDVIEHVDDDNKAVSEMSRVCRNGGQIVCTVPAYSFLWSHHDEVNQHKRRYTLSRLKKLFSKMTIQYAGYFNAILFLPIALVRMADRIFKPKFIRKDSGSDFSIIKNENAGKLFHKVMLADNFFIKRKISIPFGVSILLSASKNHP